MNNRNINGELSAGLKNMFDNVKDVMFKEHTAVMLLIEPYSGRIMDFNPSACLFYGYSREELLNMYTHDLNTLPEEELKRQRLLALHENKNHFVFNHRLKNGEIRIVEIYSCPVNYKDGKLLFSIIFDITEKEKYKRELFLEKELLRTTLMSIGDGVVTTDNNGIITSMNMVSEKITGWRMEEVIGKPFEKVFILLNEETDEKAENPVSKVLETGKIVGLANHTALISKEGKKIPIADSAAPIKDEKGEIFGVVMVFRDVTIEKEQQKRITYLSYHDTLTGLFNRRFMDDVFKKADYSELFPLSIIMADINGLKLANDVFGHDEGDRLLVKATEIIKENCRKEDIVFRWGGDEFLIMLPRTTLKEAEEIMKRIRRKCSKNSNNKVNLSIAMGCDSMTSSSEKIANVIKKAEEQMYRHKLIESRSYRNSIINTLLATLYEKSMETEEHAERLKNNSLVMGRKLKLSPKELDELALLAMLHDIGKVGIKKSVLQKSGSLTDEEWEEIRKHPEIGYRIAQNIPELSTVAEYILSHHERWDGKGYPRGLKGEEIPLLCRILSVMDAYDAMTSDRPYRKAMSKEDSIEEIVRNSGTQFDPEIVKIFVSNNIWQKK